MTALALPCERVLSSLAALSASTAAAQPQSAPAAGWQRALGYLHGELGRMGALSGSIQTTAAGSTATAPGTATAAYRELQQTALRLTQLARTLDGLPLGQASAPLAARVLEDRRMVVLASWHLLQALVQHAALGDQRASRNASGSVSGSATGNVSGSALGRAR